jgi:hypothetical protein
MIGTHGPSSATQEGAVLQGNSLLRGAHAIGCALAVEWLCLIARGAATTGARPSPPSHARAGSGSNKPMTVPPRSSAIAALRGKADGSGVHGLRGTATTGKRDGDPGISRWRRAVRQASLRQRRVRSATRTKLLREVVGNESSSGKRTKAPPARRFLSGSSGAAGSVSVRPSVSSRPELAQLAVGYPTSTSSSPTPAASPKTGPTASSPQRSPTRPTGPET